MTFHCDREEFGLASISERESREVEAANASGTTPVVLTKKTLEEGADHTADVIARLGKRPAVLGHSTGGLVAQMLAGRGLSAATVAIDPGVFRGVLPLPLSTLRATGPFLLNPRYRGRAITLTFDQFKYGWTNALDEDEAKRLYDTYHVAGSGIALAQMAIANAAYKRQKRNPSVTEIKKMPNRGHSLTIDHGWQEVAQTALDFVKRFVPAKPRRPLQPLSPRLPRRARGRRGQRVQH